MGRKGRVQGKYMCLGVYGRGLLDEDEWEEDLEIVPQEDLLLVKSNYNHHLRSNNNNNNNIIKSLQEWSGDRLITTRCDNKDAVIEWVAVPFIHHEEEEEEEDEEEDVESDDEEL